MGSPVKLKGLLTEAEANPARLISPTGHLVAVKQTQQAMGLKVILHVYHGYPRGQDQAFLKIA